MMALKRGFWTSSRNPHRGDLGSFPGQTYRSQSIPLGFSVTYTKLDQPWGYNEVAVVSSIHAFVACTYENERSLTITEYTKYKTNLRRYLELRSVQNEANVAHPDQPRRAKRTQSEPGPS